MIKQWKIPLLPCPVCGSDAPADKVLRDSEGRGAMIQALQEIAGGLPDVRAVHRLTESKIIAQRALGFVGCPREQT